MTLTLNHDLRYVLHSLHVTRCGTVVPIESHGSYGTHFLDGVECQAKNLFEQTVKSLAENEQVTEKLKAENMILWVQKMNSIHNRAAEIVNEQVIYR